MLLRTTNFVTIIEIVLHYHFFEDIHKKQDVNNPLYFSHFCFVFFLLVNQTQCIETIWHRKLYLIFFPGGYYFAIIWQNKDQYLVSSQMWDIVLLCYLQYTKTYLANIEKSNSFSNQKLEHDCQVLNKMSCGCEMGFYREAVS